VLRHRRVWAVNSNFLPYVSILPVFAALRAYSKTLPPQRQLDAHRKLRHWYWPPSPQPLLWFRGVHKRSRFSRLKAWFDDDMAEPALVAEFATRFRNLELRKEIKRGTSVYNGVFNLLVLQGALTG